jgi:hypothetical protein
MRSKRATPRNRRPHGSGRKSMGRRAATTTHRSLFPMWRRPRTRWQMGRPPACSTRWSARACGPLLTSSIRVIETPSDWCQVNALTASTESDRRGPSTTGKPKRYKALRPVASLSIGTGARRRGRVGLCAHAGYRRWRIGRMRS